MVYDHGGGKISGNLLWDRFNYLLCKHHTGAALFDYSGRCHNRSDFGHSTFLFDVVGYEEAVSSHYEASPPAKPTNPNTAATRRAVSAKYPTSPAFSALPRTPRSRYDSHFFST